MRITTLALVLVIIGFSGSVAAREAYPVKDIPASLLVNADAVIRDLAVTIDVKSATEIIVTRRCVVTVLNEKGVRNGMMTEYYNKGIHINSMEGRLYDKDGIETKKMKNGEIVDVSVSGENFFDENRVKGYVFKTAGYPYTCMYEVTKTYDSWFYMSPWDPQFAYNCSVEYADLTVNCPTDLKLNYRVYRTAIQPKVKTADGIQTLKIAIDSLAAVKEPDDFAQDENFRTPTVVVMLDDVKLDDVKGKMGTWKDFGSFIYDLNANRDDLPPAARQMVHQLTDTCTSRYSKISVLYEYLKANTRYVNVVLGIGGWQTLKAGFVAEKGYGDCKALSNYMKALLKEAGIPAYAVLAYGGKSQNRILQEDFPFHVFNHMILCVPDTRDTVWLECTSKTLPAGYLSSFTSDRKVLLLTSDGGVVVRTPVYNEKSNRLHRSATMTIDDHDELHGAVSCAYVGYWWEKERDVLEKDKAHKDSYFNGKYLIPTYSAGAYTINTASADRLPVINEYVPLSGSGVITRAGKHIFLSPKVLGLVIDGGDVESRTDSFQIANDYLVSDTTTITLTGNYTAEKLPKEISREMPFGEYHTHVLFENKNCLKIIVDYHQRRGVYPAAQYPEYTKFSKVINLHEAYDKVVLTKLD